MTAMPKPRVRLSDDERKKFDSIGLDDINSMVDVAELHKLHRYMEEEGFPQTSAVVKARMTALGAKAFPDDPAARAKSDADANDFLGDLRKWTAATDQADSRDEEEPTFIGGEAGAPIRGASRVSVEDVALPPSKPSDDEDESAGRMPTPEELAKAEAMLGGMSNLAKPADAKEEDLSVPGASVDVQRTLKAMRGASEKEKKWVAMREKEKGNELFKAKEFRSAIEAYTLSLKLDPDSPAVHSNRAAALMKQGRWHDAIADCTCALDLDPKFFKALMRRGAAYLETGEAGSEQRALDDLTAAAAIDPANKEVRRLHERARRAVVDNVERKGMRRVAIVEEDGGGDDAAAEEINATTETNAAAEEAKSRGNDLFKAKRYADAVVAYTEALATDPTMSAALCNRSGARYLLGEYAAAEADASAAANLDPTYAKAFHRRACARWRLGNLDGALADYDVALGLKPGDGDLAAERRTLADERRASSLKPARSGPMVIEEIEEPPPAEEASPKPTRPTPTRPTPAKPDAVRRIAIEEDSDDSADDDGDAADPKAPPPDKTDKTDETDTTDTRAADELKRRADDAFKRGDMDGAESLYTSCLESGAALGDEKMALAVRANRAAARLKLEKYPEAESDANWVLARDPRHVKATHRRAAARAKMGQYAGALEDYAVVKRAFPRHKGVAEEIEIVEGLAAEASERARDARRSRPESPAFGKTRSPKPDPPTPPSPGVVSGEASAESLKKEGNAAFVRAKYFEADELYTKAIEVATERRTKAILLANRAATRLKVGKHADAEMDASSAIECDGTYVKGYHRRAQARTNLGLFEPALEDFERVVRATPDSKTLQAEVNACMQKAAEAMMRGMDLGGSVISGGAGAQSELRAHTNARKPIAIQEDSDDSDDDVVDGVGDAPPPTVPTASEDGTHDDGTQDGTGDAVPNKPFRKSVPIVEEDSSDDEDDDDALPAEAAEAATMEPSVAPEGAEGAEAVASDVHRATPAADPTEAAEAAKDRGNALFKSGDFKSAEVAYTEAIALDPSSAAYHANRAAARLKLHDHANALADATAALALDATHTKARHRRAMALAELERFDEAAAEYDFVERAYPGHAGVRAEAKAARDAAETARIQSKAAAATEREKAKAMAAAVAEEEGVSAPSSPAQNSSQDSSRNASNASSPRSIGSTPEKSKLAVEAKAAAAAAILREKQSSKKPRTATELERGCKSLRGKPEELSAFLATVTDEELVKTLKASVSADVLGAYAEVWEKHEVPAGKYASVARTARALASLPRFAFAAMMMKPADKKSATAVFNRLDAEGVANARKDWKV